MNEDTVHCRQQPTVVPTNRHSCPQCPAVELHFPEEDTRTIYDEVSGDWVLWDGIANICFIHPDSLAVAWVPCEPGTSPPEPSSPPSSPPEPSPPESSPPESSPPASSPPETSSPGELICSWSHGWLTGVDVGCPLSLEYTWATAAILNVTFTHYPCEVSSSYTASWRGYDADGNQVATGFHAFGYGGPGGTEDWNPAIPTDLGIVALKVVAGNVNKYLTVPCDQLEPSSPPASSPPETSSPETSSPEPSSPPSSPPEPSSPPSSPPESSPPESSPPPSSEPGCFIFDSFTGPDGTALGGRAADTGQVWTGSSTLVLAGGGLVMGSYGMGDGVAIDAGTSDFVVDVDFTMSSWGVPNTWLWVRFLDTGNYIQCYFLPRTWLSYPAQISISKMVGGSSTPLATLNIPDIAHNQTGLLRISCRGDAIEFSALNFGIADQTVSASVAGFVGGNKITIGGYTDAGNFPTPKWDNFCVKP